MRKGETNYSILYLKQKFDEIRKNINNIEQRQKDFFSSRQGDIDSISNNDQRSYSHQFQGPTQQRFHSTERRITNQENDVSQYLSIIQKLERANQELLDKLMGVVKEKDLLQQQFEEQKSRNLALEREKNAFEIQIKQLQHQLHNISFDAQNSTSFSQFLNTSRSPQRPSSIIRSHNSSPKKNRVAFSKDLENVVHIRDDDYKKFRNSPILKSTQKVEQYQPKTYLDYNARLENQRQHLQFINKNTVSNTSYLDYSNDSKLNSSYLNSSQSQRQFYKPPNQYYQQPSQKSSRYQISDKPSNFSKTQGYNVQKEQSGQEERRERRLMRSSYSYTDRDYKNPRFRYGNLRTASAQRLV